MMNPFINQLSQGACSPRPFVCVVLLILVLWILVRNGNVALVNVLLFDRRSARFLLSVILYMVFLLLSGSRHHVCTGCDFGPLCVPCGYYLTTRLGGYSMGTQLLFSKEVARRLSLLVHLLKW